MPGDVEPIQHMQSVAGLCGDDLQIGFPHVAAHEPQTFYDLRPQRSQAAPQGGLCAPFTYPEQTPAAGVDLVNDGQKVIGAQTVAPVNLIHSDGFDSTQLAVRQAPLDKPFHRAIDGFPTGLEHPRRFPPTQSPRPPRQESHHGAGNRTFAVTPRDMLDDDAVRGTLHTARRIAEPGGDAP